MSNWKHEIQDPHKHLWDLPYKGDDFDEDNDTDEEDDEDEEGEGGEHIIQQLLAAELAPGHSETYIRPGINMTVQPLEGDGGGGGADGARLVLRISSDA